MRYLLKTVVVAVFVLLLTCPGTGEAEEGDSIIGNGSDSRPYIIYPSHKPILEWNNTNPALWLSKVELEVRAVNNQLLVNASVLNDGHVFSPLEEKHKIPIDIYLDALPLNGFYFVQIRVESPEGEASPWSDHAYFQFMEQPAEIPAKVTGCRIW